jgi:hypothetical protein
MTTMLCLDPGGTTGLAIISFEPEQEASLVHYEQVPGGLEGFINWYKSEREIWNWDMVVCEDFTLRMNVKFPDLSPVYIIGALEAFEWPDKPTYQQPTQKPLCDDDRLKVLGFHKPGKGHANDAIRHGIIYLRKSRHMPTLKKGWAINGL